MIKQVLAVVLIVISLSCFTQNSYAWGPISHCGLVASALKQVGSCEALTLTQGDLGRWFYIGTIFPDITVLHYYTTFKKYESTHDFVWYHDLWNVASQTGSDEAKAFALGVGTHLIQDAIVHNVYMPLKIRTTLMQNNIIHPLTEGMIEGKFTTIGDPWYSLAAETQAKTSFMNWDTHFSSTGSKVGLNLMDYNPITFAVYTMGLEVYQNSLQDYVNDASAFSGILQGGQFYDRGYVIPGGDLWWGMYKWIAGVARNFIKTDDVQYYYDLTITKTKEWYESGNYANPDQFTDNTSYTPSGLKNLQTADGYVTSWGFVSVFLLGVAVFSYVYLKRMRAKGRVMM